MSPEQRLFRAIVSQAVIDAAAPGPAQPEYQAWMKKRIKREQRKMIEPSDVARKAAWDEALRCWGVLASAHEQNARDARNWLLINDQEFPIICTLAGYDPNYIRSKARKLKAAGWVSAKESDAIAA